MCSPTYLGPEQFGQCSDELGTGINAQFQSLFVNNFADGEPESGF